MEEQEQHGGRKAQSYLSFTDLFCAGIMVSGRRTNTVFLSPAKADGSPCKMGLLTAMMLYLYQDDMRELVT
jgi:hypothetical protein